MRVGHVVHRLAIGGLENVLIETIRGLEVGYSHVVISLTDVLPEQRARLPAGVEVFEIHKREGHDLAKWWVILRLLQRLKLDVLHTYNLAALEFQFVGTLAGIGTRIHAEHGRHASDPTGTNARHRLLRRLMKPFVTTWVAVSNDLEKWLRNDVRIPPEQIELIVNGIDTKHFSPADKAHVFTNFKRVDGLANRTDRVIGTIGRLDPVKDQRLLIDAFYWMKNNHPAHAANLYLMIIGGGPLFAELDSHVKALGMDEYIWLADARTDIKHLLQQMDVFVLTSVAEGTPITLLEAMAMGLPVAATAVGGIPEVMAHECGVLLTSRNAADIGQDLLRLINDVPSQQRLGQRARKRVEERFSITAMLLRYQSVYSADAV